MTEKKIEKLRALTLARLENARAEVKYFRAEIKHFEAVLKTIPGKEGRPKGSTNMTPRAVANNRAVLHALIEIDEEKSKAGRKTATQKITLDAIAHACERHPLARKETVTELVRRKEVKRFKSK